MPRTMIAPNNCYCSVNIKNWKQPGILYIEEATPLLNSSWGAGSQACDLPLLQSGVPQAGQVHCVLSRASSAHLHLPFQFHPQHHSTECPWPSPTARDPFPPSFLLWFSHTSPISSLLLSCRREKAAAQGKLVLWLIFPPHGSLHFLEKWIFSVGILNSSLHCLGLAAVMIQALVGISCRMGGIGVGVGWLAWPTKVWELW